MSIPQQNPKPITLLCIDDDVEILGTLSLYFSHEPDIAVQTCSSATDALNLLNSQHFDAIICDYSMPDMDGIELLRELRSRKDDAIFITLTGRRLTQVAIDTLNLGGNYYMQKGVHVIRDLEKVASLIREQQKTRQAPSPSPQTGTPHRSGGDTPIRSCLLF